MPVIAADLTVHGAANMPEDDASLTGGAIDTAVQVELTALAANDVLEAVSDNAADTMNLTITGRLASGSIASETVALNGLTVVQFPANTLERVLKHVLALVAAGTITIRRTGGGATVATLAPGRSSGRRLFYASASEAGATTRFEKVFKKNENATLTLNSAAVKLTADPAAVIRIGCAPTKGDSATVANRKTTPAGVTFVDDGVSQGVPTGALAAAETIGVWVEQALGAGAAAIKSSCSIELAGTTA